MIIISTPAAKSEVIKSMEHASLYSLRNMGAANVGVLVLVCQGQKRLILTMQ